MPYALSLPELGEGVTEGEVVAWHVAAGDAVAVDDTVVEVMTGEATVTIPSPVSGRVVATRGVVGEQVAVGAVLAEIDTGAAPGPGGDGGPAPRRVRTTPATRRLARELCIELADVPGTGKGGRVTPADVRRALAVSTEPGLAVQVPARPVEEILPGLPPAGSPPPVSAGPSCLESRARIPIRGLRRRIAERVAEAWSHAVHLTFVEEADVSRLVEASRRMSASLGPDGPPPALLPFVVKAVVAALKRHPHMNAWIDDAAGELVQHSAAHVGIATATADGVVVPVVRNAGRLSLKDLALEMARVADAARAGTAKPDELSGSTFSVADWSAYGGLMATPIVNYPEVAVLGVHRVRRRPVVLDDDRIVPRDVLSLSASFDSRVIDAHVGAAFVNEVIRYLVDPDLLFLELV